MCPRRTRRVPFALKTADFDYKLPPELIAQHPVEPRDSARLLVLDRATGRLEHSRFHALDRCLRPGDLLVALLLIALVAAALLHDVGHMMQKAGENAADPNLRSGTKGTHAMSALTPDLPASSIIVPDSGGATFATTVVPMRRSSGCQASRRCAES